MGLVCVLALLLFDQELELLAGRHKGLGDQHVVDEAAQPVQQGRLTPKVVEVVRQPLLQHIDDPGVNVEKRTVR